MNNIFEELRTAAEKACRLSHEIGRLSQVHLNCITDSKDLPMADKVKKRLDTLNQELERLKDFLCIK